jgi:Mrp family chromosome partitioning ATPase
MRVLLGEMEGGSDLVIVDTPAALAVSDAVPLMKAVTGVVLVARMNRSSRDTIRRLRKIVESAQGTLLGVVATGVSWEPGYEHYSRSYYTSDGNGSKSQSKSKSNSKASKRSSQPSAAPAPSAPTTVELVRQSYGTPSQASDGAENGRTQPD